MTTESVLEKLKELAILHDQNYADYLEVLDLFEVELLPNLIAALELVELKAKDPIDLNGYGYSSGNYDGRIEFARELLAVVNGETKGERDGS